MDANARFVESKLFSVIRAPRETRGTKAGQFRVVDRVARAAQFAEGLDEEDAYGWWEYQSEDAGDDSAPIGLEKSIDRLVTGIAGSISHGRVCHHVMIFI